MASIHSILFQSEISLTEFKQLDSISWIKLSESEWNEIEWNGWIKPEIFIDRKVTKIGCILAGLANLNETNAGCLQLIEFQLLTSAIWMKFIDSSRIYSFN